MKSPDQLLDKIASQLTDFASHGKQATEEARGNIRALIQSQMQKLDVVSREDFEAQQLILEKTREKITDLEKKLAELEERLS